ncbi:MAG: alkaline phosphatase [Candidatus Doudnabacteria bacterium RIFCSPLOWO2_02_FULL_48_8]|nr:MAG: alkaline phosphatase [Candidatus Doudnabacteria bacterium RIFCSPLOWO2_02_FULL_48_8]
MILTLTNFITQTISNLGYTGVALLMAIESAAIPLPSEIIMPFSGFLVEGGRFTLLGLALAGAVGSVIGSMVTYALGYYGGRPLILKYGRYVLIFSHDLELTEKFFQKFGKFSVFIGRLLPVVRTFISIPAGIGKVPIWPFVFYAFLGSFIWSYFLAWLGFKLGENWQTLESYFRRFDAVVVIVIVIVIAWWIRRHLKNRLK